MNRGVASGAAATMLVRQAVATAAAQRRSQSGCRRRRRARVKFGLFLLLHQPDIRRPFEDLYRDAIEQAQYAEELGFESVAIPEHYYFNFVTCPSALQLAV